MGLLPSISPESLIISFQPSGRTVREHSVRRTSVLSKKVDGQDGRETEDLRLRYGCSRPQACAMLSVRNLARDVPCRVSSRVFKSIAALRRAHARCAFLGAWMHAHGTFRMHVCMRERPLLTHVPCPPVRARACCLSDRRGGEETNIHVQPRRGLFAARPRCSLDVAF